MKNLLKVKNLPVLTAVLGVVGMVLRWMLYALCMDANFLLPENHPLEILLWLITVAALAYIGINAWKLGGSNRYGDNFRASVPAAAGHFVAGAGMLLTALLNDPMMGNHLGGIWKLLGLLSGPSLMLAGLCRVQGKRPFFLLHMIPCLFLVFHIINHYQVWSGNPQLQDYVFALFGTMAMMFFAFYMAAFDVGSGRRRMHLFMGLAVVYLCLVNLPQTQYLFLYVGGIIWALTDLCTLNPKPRSRKIREGEKPNDAA